MQPSESAFLAIRGRRYHVRCWGPPDAPRLFLLHGWMDVSASFQFMVDAFERPWRVIAPDWRGFGLSQWNPGVYWFLDYLADLDALLAILSPDRPADVAGHSLGGNLACLYAGVRPERVRRIATLEGFGIQDTRPEDAPKRLAKWLQQVREPPAFREYASLDQVAARLRKNNPRLTPERALFLAGHWTERRSDDRVGMLADPGHKIVNATLYRLAESMAVWRRIACPVLWVDSSDAPTEKWLRETPEGMARRKACFARFSETTIADAGHMMHVDQPEACARVVERFFTEDAP